VPVPFRPRGTVPVNGYGEAFLRGARSQAILLTLVEVGGATQAGD
jgi:hypothetical protein